MSTTPNNFGIRPQQSVSIVERRDGKEIIHSGLVLAISMDQNLLGFKGEPALEVVFIDAHDLRYAGSSEWHKVLTRLHHVVHLSHPRWMEERTAFAYFEPPISLSTESYIGIAARAAHEANRILCAMLGDFSQPIWAEAPDWQKNSAELGVKAIVSNPATTPQQSHESWSAVKLADGWKYGPVKDAKKKEHPCLVPYEELPHTQQMKDWMFGAVTRGVLDFPQTPLVPPSTTEQDIKAQDAHDEVTGNLNSSGETPYQAVVSEDKKGKTPAEKANKPKVAPKEKTKAKSVGDEPQTEDNEEKNKAVERVN
jgi:hypothetical protein